MAGSVADRPAGWAVEAWVRAVLDGADFLVLATDADGVIHHAGGAVRPLLGYAPEELIGRTPLHLSEPAELVQRAKQLSRELGRDIEPSWEALTAKAAEIHADEWDWLAVRRDGSTFSARVIVKAVREHPHDEPTGFTLVARDLSGQRAVEQALRESEERFRGAFDHSSVGMALVAPDGRWLQANRALCRMLDYSEDELRRLNFVDVSHPEDTGVSIMRNCELLGGERHSYQLQKRYRRRDSRVVWALENVSLVRGPDRRPLYFIKQIMDITAQRRAEEALRESEERYRDLFENASDLIQIADERGELLYVNRAWREKLGYAESEVRGLNLADVLHPEDREPSLRLLAQLPDGGPGRTIETRFLRRDGRIVLVDGNISCTRGDAQPAVTRAILRDVTDRRGFEEVLDEYRSGLEVANRKLAAANTLLEEMATTDPLTSLKNRLVLSEKLDEEFQRTQRYQVPLALVLLDVDRFKLFNDTFGHPAGDEVLRLVASVLQETARTTDVVARFGGEEFAVLLPNTDLEGAINLAERFRAAIEMVPWQRWRVTASFGVAAVTAELADASALVSAADAALYRAKQAGRNRVECFGAERLDETAVINRPMRR